MSYLASPLDRIAREYDVVVVGSGYGGAIAASRLARAGLSVCVLERGEEFQPGDFPESPAEGFREMQIDAPDRRVGSTTALFDFHLNPDISVLSGCGLGGTSLINANVAVRPDPRVWLDPVWPEAVRADLEGRIEQGVQRALEMLRPSAYPETFPSLAKLAAQERSARAMGANSYRLPITVNFENHLNHVGVEQPACNGCGNCVSGCNTGAKNTLVTNYLPDAVNHGAQIFTRTRVHHVEKRGSGWLVRFDTLDPGRTGFKAERLYVGAKTVVIAAGSLGSTEILLRSRDAGLSLSDRLGHGFTGNGDVLGFAYNADHAINGIGVMGRDVQDGPGPCITTVIDLRDADRLEDGMIIEEGSIPSPLSPMLAASLFLAARAVGKNTERDLRQIASDGLRELEAFVPGGDPGAVANTQIFLVMAHDDARGQIHLQDGRVRISWPGVGSQPIFARIERELQRAATALGGTFIKNPVWTERLGRSLVTVHPLGGCGMGETAESGVVDHSGMVFSGRSGGEVHDGLYVCDGAVIPRSLGANPLLTISALAERMCAIMTEARSRPIDYSLPSRPRAPRAEKRVGVQFTEAMRGFWSPDPNADFQIGAQQGEQSGSRLEFIATVTSDDLDGMLNTSEHRATIFGTLSAPLLSAEPMTVNNGTFQLFTHDADAVRTRRMNYQMPITTPDGTRYFMHGYKVVRDDTGVGLDIWPDTSTLYVTVYRGDDEKAPVAGRGILRIHPRDFARQMTTFKVTNAGGVLKQLRAAADFGLFFAGSLYQTYGGVLAPRSELDPDAPPRRKRELRAPDPEVHPLQAGDGVPLRLVRYHGGERGPVLLLHGLGTASRVFTLDTVDVNLVEYLCAAGYDVWLLDYRASTDLPASEAQFTADDVATHDLPSALARVREVAGTSGVDVFAHGLGGITLLMSLVDGLEGVRSAMCSQAGLYLRAPVASRLKAGLHLPAVLKALGKETLHAERGGGKSWKNRLLDLGLRALPGELEEWCTSPVCKRITFLYGPSYEHDQINKATHDTLHELFGVVNLTVFDHLARMVREGHAINADGTSCLRDLGRLAIPMTFVHGAENGRLLPAGTLATMEALRDANGDGLYRHEVVPNYGDTDCLIGKRANRDFYPRVLHHLRSVAAARTQ